MPRRRLDDFAFYPDARESLDRLKAAGFRLVVATNQPDVGNGKVAREVVEEMHARILQALPVDAVKVCYHGREDECACRKPSPGMLLEAAAELHIDAGARAIWSAIACATSQAGRAAGCRTVFIDRGYTAEPRADQRRPDCAIARRGGRMRFWQDREGTRPQ